MRLVMAIICATLCSMPTLGAGQHQGNSTQQEETAQRLTGHLVTYVDGSRVRIYAERLQVSGPVIELLNGRDRAALVATSQVRSIVRLDTWIEEDRVSATGTNQAREMSHLVTYVDGMTDKFYSEELEVSGSVIHLIRGGDRSAVVVLNEVKSILRSDTWFEDE